MTGKSPSVRSRLFLILLGLGACLILFSGYLYRTTESLFYQGLRSELRGDLDWLTAAIERDPKLLAPGNVDSLCKAIGRYKGYRLTVVDTNGRVLGDSYVLADSVPLMETPASRPEIQQAIREGYGTELRFSHSVGMEMLYVAKSSGAHRPILRMAASSKALQGFRREALVVLVWLLCLFVFLAIVLMAWLSRTVSEPLLRLAVDAHDITRPLRWNANLREAEVLNQAFAEYVDAIRKLAEDVRKEHERSAAVLNRLEEGIVLLSAEGLILTANPAARKLLAQEMTGLKWEGRLFSEMISHPGLRKFIDEITNNSRPPFLQVDRNGEFPFDLLCHLRLFGATNREYLLTIVDVTDFRNLDRAKSDFVANASHELKTPLSSILGYSEALIDGALDNSKTRENFVKKIHDNALRLQRLVQDLLNLSQLESQSQPRHAERLPLRTYVQAAGQLIRGEMESQGIRFENHVPVEIKVRMEPRDLELVCNNLIGNAVRYNQPGGKIKVAWDLETRRLSVRDTGIGIPPEMLPRIFERFYRADSSRARKDGTGLGLAIVKHAAQRYGMSVRAESKVGEGSEFFVEMPAEVVADDSSH